MTTRRWLALPASWPRSWSRPAAAGGASTTPAPPTASAAPRRRAPGPGLRGAAASAAARGDQARLRHPRPGQSVHPADHRRRQRRAEGPQRRPPGHRSRGRRRRRPAQGRPDARRVGRPGHRHVGPRRDRWPAALNEIVDSGIADRPVQPARDLGQGAVRRRALGRERPHPRPEGRSRSSAARAPRARSSSATASRASRCSRTGPRASRNRSRPAAGLEVLGPFDVKVAANENYAAWEALLAANPDAKALVGLCAPDIASLGKLQAANAATAVRLRRLRPDRREPRRDQGRQRLRQPRPDPVHAGLPAGQDAGRHHPRHHDRRPVAGRVPRRRHGDRDGRQRAGAVRPAAADLRRARGAGGLAREDARRTTSRWSTARSRTGPSNIEPIENESEVAGPRASPMTRAVDAHAAAGGRGRRPAQGVRRDPGPHGRGSRHRARHRPRRRRRERRRQVHADEDPRRRRPAGRRRGRVDGERRPLRLPGRCPRASASASSTRSSASSRSGPSWPTCSPTTSRRRFGLVDLAEMRRRAAPVLARIGLDVDPDTLVGELGIGERQLVELSRVLIERPGVLDPRRAELRAQRARDAAAVHDPARAVGRRR